MGDFKTKLEFEIALAQGGEKAIRGATKVLMKELTELQNKFNAKQAEITQRAANGAPTVRATKQLNKLRTEMEKLGAVIFKNAVSEQDYAALSRQLTQKKIESQKKLNEALKLEAKLRKAAMDADVYGINRNRKARAREERIASRLGSFVTRGNMAADIREITANRRRNAYESQFQGQYSQLPQNYFNNLALQRNRGAKSIIPPNYFAEVGSVSALKSRLSELTALRDLKAPNSAGFRNLSTEIGNTEKQLNKLTNRVSGDGMASFRKFSHMLFNITGIFFVVSRGFQGLMRVLTRGASLDTMRQAFRGTTEDIERMSKASRGMLSLEKMFAFSNKASDLGIKIKDQPIFIDMAIRSMKAYGGGVERLDEILEKVIKSTETAQKELSSLGIKKVDFKKKVNDLSKELVEHNEKYALVNASLEKSKKVRKDYLLELDAEDQKTVKVQALLSLYGKSLKDVTDVMPTAADKILSINAQWENFTNILGQRLLPVGNAAFPIFTKFFEFITSNSTNLVISLGAIAAALTALSISFFAGANPLGGVAAALVAITAGMAAFKTAFPDTQTKLDSSVSNLIMATKDLRGEYESLGTLYEEVGGVANAQQQALIDKTETLISKNRERMDQESQLSKILTEERVKAIEKENQVLLAKEKLLKAAQEHQAPILFPQNRITGMPKELREMPGMTEAVEGRNLNFVWSQLTNNVENFNTEIALTKEKIEQNKKAIDDYYKSLDQRSLLSVIIRNFGSLGQGMQGFAEHLLNGTASVNTLKYALIGLGQEGVAAMYGISAAALKNATALKFLLQAIGLQYSAADLYKSGNPSDKALASSYVSIANKLIEGIRTQYPIKEEQRPGNTTNTGNRGGKDEGQDLQAIDDKLKLILDKYNTWLERQKAVNNLIDDIGTLATQQVPAGTALDYMNKVLTPTEGEIKLPEALKEILKLQDEEIENVKKNTKEKLSEAQQDERIAAIKRKLGEAYANIIASQTEKVKEVTRAEIEQIKALEQKVSMQEAIKRVGDSMRDASKPWNPGIKNVMTFFEMSEIGVRSLADTITGELGEAWDNVFGEANSLFEKFLKNVTTKILETLVTRGIGLLLSVLFPGVGTILGAGLNAAVGGGVSGGGGGAMGAPNLGNYINNGMNNSVQARSVGVPYILTTKVAGKDIKLALDRYSEYDTNLLS